MTKENSATLAEWDYFDDGEDDPVSQDFRSPNEHRRSRRESGRFVPFCETDAYETAEDDAFAMDAADTSEILEDETIKMDVGKTFDMNVVRGIKCGSFQTKSSILTCYFVVHEIDSRA